MDAVVENWWSTRAQAVRYFVRVGDTSEANQQDRRTPSRRAAEVSWNCRRRIAPPSEA